MVTTTLKTISKAEKELEQMVASSSTKDPSEQWGKQSLKKITDKTEDICL